MQDSNETNSEFNERVEFWKNHFTRFEDWEARYKELIRLGKELPEFPEGERKDQDLVKGCQSKVWLKAQNANGKLHLQGDSDALIVKGILALVLDVYHDKSLDQVLAYQNDFLSELGITAHLSMNRSNGLAAILKQIKLFALALKSLQG